MVRDELAEAVLILMSDDLFLLASAVLAVIVPESDCIGVRLLGLGFQVGYFIRDIHTCMYSVVDGYAAYHIGTMHIAAPAPALADLFFHCDNPLPKKNMSGPCSTRTSTHLIYIIQPTRAH